jgi:hypothetical protein
MKYTVKTGNKVSEVNESPSQGVWMDLRCFFRQVIFKVATVKYDLNVPPQILG